MDQVSLCEFLLPEMSVRLGLDDGAFMSPSMLRNLLFSTQGWRLTKTGAELLASMFQSYVTTNEENTIITGKVLLGMDRCCNSPWHISGKSVVVFNPSLHLEIQIVGGKLTDFIDFKQLKP